MPIQFISPKKAVNSAFLKLPVSVENMERFRLSLANLYKKRDAARDEEYHKGEIWGFFKGIFNPDYSVQVNYCVLARWDEFMANPDYYIEKTFNKRSQPIADDVIVYP